MEFIIALFPMRDTMCLASCSYLWIMYVRCALSLPDQRLEWSFILPMKWDTRLYFSAPYRSFLIWTSSGSCLFSRFWAAIDPDEMDEEASSLEKHQSISLQSAVNCEKKASYKILIFISSIYFVKHFNNIYAIPGRHWWGGRHLFSSLANTWCDQVNSFFCTIIFRELLFIHLFSGLANTWCDQRKLLSVCVSELTSLCAIVWLKLLHM